MTRTSLLNVILRLKVTARMMVYVGFVCQYFPFEVAGAAISAYFVMLELEWSAFLTYGLFAFLSVV